MLIFILPCKILHKCYAYPKEKNSFFNDIFSYNHHYFQHLKREIVNGNTAFVMFSVL